MRFIFNDYYIEWKFYNQRFPHDFEVNIKSLNTIQYQSGIKFARSELSEASLASTTCYSASGTFETLLGVSTVVFHKVSIITRRIASLHILLPVT